MKHYSEEVCAFVNAILEIDQKQYKEFVDANYEITKNNFVTPAKINRKSRLKENVYS